MRSGHNFAHATTAVQLLWHVQNWGLKHILNIFLNTMVSCVIHTMHIDTGLPNPDLSHWLLVTILSKWTFTKFFGLTIYDETLMMILWKSWIACMLLSLNLGVADALVSTGDQPCLYHWGTSALAIMTWCQTGNKPWTTQDLDHCITRGPFHLCFHRHNSNSLEISFTVIAFMAIILPQFFANL